MDGYFIFTYGDGTMQASGLNDVTIATTDKTKEQAKTGGLTRGLPFNGQYYVSGPNFGAVYAEHGSTYRLSVHALLCDPARLAQPLCGRWT
jgi:hypothetical protein